MYRIFLITFIACTFLIIPGISQECRFLQEVDYKMDLDFNLKKHQFDGKQVLKYTNHSKDTLHRIFYHLYFNAFKPDSEMDIMSRTIKDPDKRIGDRIKNLRKSEQGFVDVKSLTMDGKQTDFKVSGTILEVDLPVPILPGKTVKLEMEFLSQIPLQIRRTGRNNAEGIEYSVAQGYPKICGYDEQGWHANPYIAREFYGPFGNFDVSIKMPSEYIIAATGVLQNPEDIGYGYSSEEPEKRDKKLEWHFKAEKVHDFVWAADPDYKHIVHKAYDGTTLRFFYQENDKTKDNWENLPKVMDAVLEYVNTNYGKYPYPEYSFIQGGDGGMEYPMATLITGERNFASLVGVSIHEMVHSWYQGVIATNESLYHWMDEGFTNYVSTEAFNHLKKYKLVPGLTEDNPQLSSVKGYINFTKTGLEEAMHTHADHFNTNAAYGAASYTKGQAFLEQLRYIVGEEYFKKGMKRYFDEWKFKHPNPNDFFRVMEKTSGMELDWFREYFVETIHTIDYTLKDYGFESIFIERTGRIPMPLDITVTYQDGKTKKYYIPLDIMRGIKNEDGYFNDFKVQKPWSWANRNYILYLGESTDNILKVQIDPSGRLADVNPSDNSFPRPSFSEEDPTK
jgi:hypothetical protein